MSASLPGTASERRGNNFKRVERLLPGSQGQDLALTVLHVPDSLFLAGVDQEKGVHHSGAEHLSTRCRFRASTTPSSRSYTSSSHSTPTPSTLNSQPSTLHPQPSTLNPQPSTLDPHLSSLNYQPSTIHLFVLEYTQSWMLLTQTSMSQPTSPPRYNPQP